ncbi:ABC-type transport auxiliary lipoprotein family protein [Ramlibacter sp. H39-3-26]|uniref:ABC-type transport auxiliary lipoprotein family protein n=1 Tax=Curvibacter soli TaxID=3031331 RepID=UPI0023DB0982|nr:ABC-type transport auxiliary lipoprotein family protein [Ramlibacter sp. H39-3-26]MDF1486297.1 ABC-type transport auxiliary lipoprotein family protein [Ramlibacter sp. H39-3-26]
MFFATLAGCSALPERPERQMMYDFGIGVVGPAPSDRGAPLPPIALAAVEPVGALDGSTAVLYRLDYADGRELRPYSRARWSMPPAQLVRQRLADRLGQRRAVLVAGESVALSRGKEGRPPSVLHVDLEEFSQLFTSPTQSAGLVRLRVTLADNTLFGEKLLGQRLVVVQRPASSNDAPGAVRALADATDAAAQDVAEWLEQMQR